MVRVLRKEKLTPKALLIELKDERAKLAKPGQFALLQLREDSEPVPLSVLDAGKSSYKLLVEAVGKSTLEIYELLEEEVYFVEFPCGKPFPLGHYGRVLLISKNWGIAPLLNVGRALVSLGNEVYMIHVASSEENVYLTEEAQKASKEFLLFTEDGSAGEEGNALWAFGFFLERFGKPNLVVSAGSNEDSSEILSLAQKKGIKHIAHVNAHILDASGICLSCRLIVGGKERLACTDGPWFDAGEVDWDYAIMRESLYREQEQEALKAFLAELSRMRRRA
ncbi:MAG: hypothetical protein GXO04_05720 [Aquificae bacterium]|nr:hypothetical protein [Aquificota bacterium]